MTEIPEELVEKVYQAIEKARTSGKIRKGANEVTKAVERGKALLVAVGEDVDPKEIVMHIPVICSEKDIPFVWVPSKKELGAAAGLSVGSSAVAIVDAGNGKALVDEIAKKLAALKKED